MESSTDSFFFSVQSGAPLWPSTGAAEASNTTLGMEMIVISVGHDRDEGRVMHRLPVPLARSSQKQEAVNYNTLTLAEN